MSQFDVALNVTRSRLSHWKSFPIILDRNPEVFGDWFVFIGALVTSATTTIVQLY